ncbi:hypothetical protein [Rhizosaccharibacter radicis]|uniref:Methyltransferase n=1 Tax=Rhizosaccharibacter radicis TaxID=2782605 RepID=A0ABT1VTY7_9PROT|nr:hypothetical protein [Acetobacteraceae bacterium KSS12]
MSDTLRARRVRYAQAILQSRSGTEALLGEGGDLLGQRVLVLGERGADTLCALVHTECLSADARLPDAFVRDLAADLVLVPHPSLRTLGRIVAQASRALRPDGRLVMAVPAEHGFAVLACRALAEAGFAEPMPVLDAGQLRLQTRRARAAQ